MRHLSHSDLFEAPDDEMVLDWNLICAARFLGVAPWELLERPVYWLEMAKIGMNYEKEQFEKLKRV